MGRGRKPANDTKTGTGGEKPKKSAPVAKKRGPDEDEDEDNEVQVNKTLSVGPAPRKSVAASVVPAKKSQQQSESDESSSSSPKSVVASPLASPLASSSPGSPVRPAADPAVMAKLSGLAVRLENFLDKQLGIEQIKDLIDNQLTLRLNAMSEERTNDSLQGKAPALDLPVKPTEVSTVPAFCKYPASTTLANGAQVAGILKEKGLAVKAGDVVEMIADFLMVNVSQIPAEVLKAVQKPAGVDRILLVRELSQAAASFATMGTFPETLSKFRKKTLKSVAGEAGRSAELSKQVQKLEDSFAATLANLELVSANEGFGQKLVALIESRCAWILTEEQKAKLIDLWKNGRFKQEKKQKVEKAK